MAAGLFPAALVVTEDQYRYLPRTFDDLRERLIVERVPTPEEAWVRVASLANGGALVASSRQFRAYERWLATDVRGDEVRLDPPDGIAAFERDGRLDALPRIAHGIEAVLDGDDLDANAHVPTDPIAIRKLVRNLASEEEAVAMGNDARTRAAYARKLGVHATSTAAERLEHELVLLSARLAGLGLPKWSGESDEGTLAELLARAQRRPTGPTVLRVGDAVHVVNPALDLDQHLAGEPRVRVHRIDSAVPVMARFLRVVDEMTEDDLFADPFLDDALIALESEGCDPLAARHARASLLFTGAVRPRASELAGDWRAVARGILALPVPLASLRIEFHSAHHHVFVTTKSRALGWQKPDSSALMQVPPACDGVITRSEPAILVKSDWDSSRRNEVERRMMLPSKPERARDPDAWLDCLEESMTRYEADPQAWQQRAASLRAGSINAWRSEPLMIDDSYWRKVDEELALAWLALADAVDQNRAVACADGSLLLAVGEGIAARLRVRRSRPSDAKECSARLSVLCAAEHFSFKLGEPTEELRIGVSAGGYDVKVRLPRRIEIVSGGHVLGAEFTSFPYGAVAAARRTGGALGAMSAHEDYSRRLRDD